MAEHLDNDAAMDQDPFGDDTDGDQPQLRPYPTGGDEVFTLLERLCPDSAERAGVPYKTNLTAALVEEALGTLAIVRSPRGLTDPAVRLSCLASLAQEAEASIDRTVTEAKDHGYSWPDIATRLGCNPDQVRDRYGSDYTWKRIGGDIDDCIAWSDDIDAESISVEDLPTPPAPPVTNHDTAAALQAALHSLIASRFPLSLQDPRAELNALASLIAQAQAAIPDVVADARDCDYLWEEIATSLAIAPTTARRRYSAHARNHQREVPPLD
jgi:hypothetical protein